MGVPVRPAGVMGADNLSEKAAKMRESLLKSQSITDNMVSILGSFDHRLSALETAMRPTQIRTHAIRRAHENIDRTLKSADVILDRFDLSREAKILRGPHEDLESYLEAIEQLRSNIVFFTNNKSFKSSDGIISHASNLLSKAISKLEQEYKQLLSSYSKSVDPDRLYECLPSSLRPSSGSPDANGKNRSNSHTSHITAENAVFAPLILIPPRVLPLLHDLAQHMVQAGHLQQCLVIYRDTRSIVLEETLQKLGVEKLSKDDVQKMQWEVLELKIGTWIHFMRIAVKLLFTAERKICDQMFEGIESLRDQCFAEVTAGSVAMLLSFGDAIAKSKRSPEKLFVLLDMYEIMRELHSEIESLFRGKACKEIRESALGLTKRLAQTAQETFGDFEEAVEKDATKTAVSDGTVHPLTSYVINYVKFLFDYQMTLKQLFQEFENGGDSNLQLASVTMRIIQALQINLEGKSKQYKDPALTNLFLMNNIHYMVRSVCRSEAKDLLGDDWVQRHRRVVQQHANQALRSLEKVDSVKYLQTSQCIGESASTSRGKEKVEENGPRKFPVPFNMLTTSTNGNGDVAVLKESAQAVAIDDDDELALKLPPEPPQKRPAFQMSVPEIDDDDDDDVEDDDDIIHVNGHVSFPPVENNNKLEISSVVNKPVAADIIEVTTPPEVFKTPALVEATPVVAEAAKVLEPEKAKPPPGGNTSSLFNNTSNSNITLATTTCSLSSPTAVFSFGSGKPTDSMPESSNTDAVIEKEPKSTISSSPFFAATTTTAATTSSGGGLFGFSSPAAASTPATTTTTTNGGGLFGFSSPAASSTTAAATTTNGGGALFGFSAPATTSTTTTAASTATNAGALFGFGLFGFSAPATTSTTTTTTAFPLFGFSPPSPTTTPTNSFFNTTTTTTSQTNPSSTTTTQSAPFQFASGPTTSPFTSSAPTFGITPVSEAKSGNSTTTTVFGSSWQQPPQNPPVFSFGASSSASPTPITFGAPKTTPPSSSSSSMFSITSPIFPNNNNNITNSNDQMSMEDSMAEDSMQTPSPVPSPLGQPSAAPGFMFGAPVAAPPQAAAPAPFQFGGPPPQNQFHSSSVEFNGGGGSLSLGSGGEKAGRRIVRVNISKNRRRK